MGIHGWTRPFPRRGARPWQRSESVDASCNAGAARLRTVRNWRGGATATHFFAARGGGQDESPQRK
eukprot:9354312-Pyramimonas_sp.AAC.1